MKEFSTFADGNDCSDCEYYEKQVEKLKEENEHLITCAVAWCKLKDAGMGEALELHLRNKEQEK